MAYKFQKLLDLNTNCFAAYFDNLPVDPHFQGENCRHRYSKLSSSFGKLSFLEHKAFIQSGEVKELEDGLIEMKEFQSLVARFVRCSEINQPVIEVGVHQIRNIADWREKGQPAPEGIHKDGFEVVGTFCVKRERVVGGETELYESKEQPPILTRLLMPGELLTFNDRDLFNFTTPIFPTTDEGLRDVFVFTVSCDSFTTPSSQPTKPSGRPSYSLP
jgi:hypothetical protein